MSFDLFQSRRTYNEPCKWWSRYISETNDLDELIMRRVPNGFFMAKEVSPETEQDNPLANTWLIDATHLTIKTPDNIYGMKSKDLVWFQGEKWIVVNVQKVQTRNQQTQFAYDKNCSHYYYIELRK